MLWALFLGIKKNFCLFHTNTKKIEEKKTHRTNMEKANLTCSLQQLNKKCTNNKLTLNHVSMMDTKCNSKKKYFTICFLVVMEQKLHFLNKRHFSFKIISFLKKTEKNSKKNHFGTRFLKCQITRCL